MLRTRQSACLTQLATDNENFLPLLVIGKHEQRIHAAFPHQCEAVALTE
ncbi:hypothetical protein [Massilia sp. TWR1-2-2]